MAISGYELIKQYLSQYQFKKPEAIFPAFTSNSPLRQHRLDPPFSLLQLLLLRLKLLFHRPQPPLIAAVGDRQPSITVRLTSVPSASPSGTYSHPGQYSHLFVCIPAACTPPATATTALAA